MKTTVRQIGEVSVLDLHGKITIGRGDVQLRERVGELLRDGRTNILVNLKKVSYMDSCGLGEVAACYKQVLARNGRFKLLSPRRGRVADLLEMIKLEELVEFYRSEEEALVSFCAN
jgi:anti-sigma B factor antagonist